MSSPKTNSLFPLILVAVLAILYRPRPFYNAVGKAQIDRASITRWTNSSALNNERCVVHREADACEDVKIHFASSTAFLACGDPEGRTHWYPSSARYDAAGRKEESFREHLFKYDIKRKETTELKIVGLEGDLITHGIDIYTFPNEPTKIHIFAVNHARGGDSISIFSHVLGSDSVVLVKDVKHPGIYNANGVAASGPLDFFITNDHYFTAKEAFLRKLEDDYGSWTWTSNVQYCDATGTIVTCRQVSDTFPGANGLLIAGDELYVGDCRSGVARVFEIQPDRSLINTATIQLGAAADNINIIPTTRDLLVTVFPRGERRSGYIHHVHELGKGFKVPGAALRLDRSEGFKPELVYYDDGSVISYMTVAAIDPYNNVLINGGVFQYGGFAVCDLTKDVV
ncbi:paraoxonase 2 [Neolentinus lepideus HHB14362 ss-1]|uniref:Paraoxonase 2 n=1 Tax=Neolentinus lepideus HHB14362 ss-1 TaxID=1314782 RepID=A0A165SEU9_9AGAM|nr:paraoxonase 2 [Neolentinus lepideus HHB14362 ss-1]